MHSFLEQWGLINYDVEVVERPLIVPNASAPPYVSVIDPFAGGVQTQILAPTALLLNDGAALVNPLVAPVPPATNLPVRMDLYTRDAGTPIFISVSSVFCVLVGL